MQRAACRFLEQSPSIGLASCRLDVPSALRQ
jgi:hypothetical protein